MRQGIRSFSIIFFADEWTDMWRRRQQIAFRLSRFDEIEKVFYVQQPLTLTSLLKYIAKMENHSAKVNWSRIFQSKSLIHKVNEKCYVVTPLAVLPWIDFRIINRLDYSFRLLFQVYLIKRLLRRLKIENPVIWVGVPFIPLELLHQFNQVLTWYDYTEDFGAFSFLKPSFREFTKHNAEYLFCHADIVSVVNQNAYFDKKGMREGIYWIPNAADIELFSHPLPNEPPEELKAIKHPIVGFVGGINPLVNVEAIEYLAQSCPQWSIVLIGDVNLSRTTLTRLQKYPSIHFLGIKPYHVLPHFIYYMDVGIHCYRYDYDFNPQKIFLYLASGKPVVELKLDGKKDANSFFVKVAGSKDEFITSIEDALMNDTQELKQKRIAWASENSWDVRSKQIVDIIIQEIEKSR